MKSKKHFLKSAVLVLAGFWIFSAQNTGVQAAGFTPKEFSKQWQIEAEKGSFRTHFLHDTLEISASKGLTLWYKEKMSGDMEIEYDACVMDEGKPGDRLSDLNCFWMATDPQQASIWNRATWRSGIFEKYYSLQMYYVGYGGNGNTTTRFRKYDGDYTSFTTSQKTPAILKEYTDASHLLNANKWVHIRIKVTDGRVEYFRNGERLVDYRDPFPLTEGWFGFRTTQSRVRIANFNWKRTEYKEVPLRWIGDTPKTATNVSFGVPFRKGEVKDPKELLVYNETNREIPADAWALAHWPDGSLKWVGFATTVPGGTEQIKVKKGKAEDTRKSQITVQEKQGKITLSTGALTAWFSPGGAALCDSMYCGSRKIAGAAELTALTELRNGTAESDASILQTSYSSVIKNITVERAGKTRAAVRIEGVHANASREWLPFTVRLYFYAGSDQVKMVHTFIYDGDQDKDFIKGLGIRFNTPLREALYNRHVAFAGGGQGMWCEPVQPLTGRRVLQLDGDATLYTQQVDGQRIPPYESFDEKGKNLIDNWASWDSYRLSQLTADGFSIRKRATTDSPWIGTASSTRSRGFAFAGDVSGGLSVSLQNFWQAYPASIEINGMRSPQAELTVWLWSPEHEAMDLRHYDKVAHDLNASYEDVQEGMSTPYGIARTSTLMLRFTDSLPSRTEMNTLADQFSESTQLACTPEYLHHCRAFGIWSLPDRSTPVRTQIESYMDSLNLYYERSVEQRRWYGFWNYGDVMHAYDLQRHEWRYDIGGYAWDNTELASNMLFWYSFLRTGSASAWRMAEAMTRHTAEVDVYHLGEMAGLGSRHNVSHWGCGAKEARISQAAWNRFYYYLTTDERCGDLMTEVKDADQILYTIDPMRLAQPREKYPCTAPARLRIGPDWLAYAGNWMTEWERTGNTAYRDKIIAGMKSISELPHGIFTGPAVLGYDPKTGVLSYEGDTAIQSTNHLMTIMGGFEVNHELIEMLPRTDWKKAWLDHATRYARMGGRHFRVPKLTAYAAWKTGEKELATEAWAELFNPSNDRPPVLNMKKVVPPFVLEPVDEANISTNDAATWVLNAIFMMEVIPIDE